MKLVVIIFLHLLYINSVAQDKFVGRYSDCCGNTVELHNDNTFKFTRRLHLASSWTKGIWYSKNDTIFFEMIPVLDTLNKLDVYGNMRDSFVLSRTEAARRIDQSDFIITLTIGGGQNKSPYPQKLLFKKSRLYKFLNGRIVRKKEIGSWSAKKYNPWYIKDGD